MADDQHRHAEAEHELQRLDRLPAKLPAFVKRPDAEAGMEQRIRLEAEGVTFNARGRVPLARYRWSGTRGSTSQGGRHVR